MKNAVIYARYSSERQTEQSIEGQLRKCNEYAAQNNLTIVDTYIDRAMTGTNDNRPAFQQMLSDCAKPVVWGIVLVYAIDRFGRNSIEIAVNKQKLKKNCKTLISATQRTSENIDGTRNLDGILLENVYIGLAEYYSAELSQKVKRGLKENRSKGLSPGGPIPFGYKSVNKKLVVDEDRAKIVLYIFQQFSQGKIAKVIVQDLTDKGITYKGKPFVIHLIYNILHAEKYIGKYEFEGVSFPDIYPAIVPKDLFYRVQHILAQNKLGNKDRRVDFLLKRKIFCGLCGHQINGESGTSKNGTRKHYYKCSYRKRGNHCNMTIYPKDAFENLVLDTTEKILNNTENVEIIADALVKKYNKSLKDTSTLSILKQDRESTHKAWENVMHAIENSVFTAGTKSRLEALETKLNDIDCKIKLEEHNEKKRLRREDIIEFVRHTVIKDPHFIIRNLINKVVAFPDRIEIYYNYTENQSPTNNPDDTNRRDFLFDKNLGQGQVYITNENIIIAVPTYLIKER